MLFEIHILLNYWLIGDTYSLTWVLELTSEILRRDCDKNPLYAAIFKYLYVAPSRVEGLPVSNLFQVAKQKVLFSMRVIQWKNCGNTV